LKASADQASVISRLSREVSILTDRMSFYDRKLYHPLVFRHLITKYKANMDNVKFSKSKLAKNFVQESGETYREDGNAAAHDITKEEIDDVLLSLQVSDHCDAERFRCVVKDLRSWGVIP